MKPRSLPASGQPRRRSLDTRATFGPASRLLAVGLLLLVLLGSTAFQTSALDPPPAATATPAATPTPAAAGAADGAAAADAGAASSVGVALPSSVPASDAGSARLPTAVPATDSPGPPVDFDRVSEAFRPTLIALLTAVPANGRQAAVPTRAAIPGVPSIAPLSSASDRAALAVTPGVLPPPQAGVGVDLSANSGSAAARAPTPAARATPGPAAVPDRPESDERGPRYAGWAMVAYPWMSAETMQQVVARQKAAGANVVWIGHNNPGEVNAQGNEPGLSYAVFEALQNEADPRREDALAIVQAQERMLRALRAQGLKAVFPVGYQSQMGSFWDAAHPDSVRLESRGGVNYTSAVSNASFYSTDYRGDVRRYYEWVDARFIRPYRDVILMVNMADEPSGGDFSTWADEAFRRSTGYRFSEVGTDAERITRLGEFQSRYIADYATWSAEQWADLEPDLPVTMSFEGATARIHLQLPHVESLFARTPANFVPTFDAYPRDGPYDMPIDDMELSRLFHLVRTLGHYSAKYNKPFWLWSTANSWGLAQASPQPANVADAVANGYYLALLARQTGGWLQGIAVWNYNVVGQGLYNDSHRTAYDPDVMFARVSEAFPRLRQIMASPAGRTRVLVLAPDRLAWRLMGAARDVDPFRFRSYDLHRLLALARNNVPAAIVGSLVGEDLGRIGTIIVLARAQQDLGDADTARLQAYLAAGGKVVALRGLSNLLGTRAEYVDGNRPEESFAEPDNAERAALWRRVLGIEQPLRTGYAVATGDDALFYTLDGSLQTDMRLAFNGRGWAADPNGYLLQRLRADGGRISVSLDKNQYAYLTR